MTRFKIIPALLAGILVLVGCSTSSEVPGAGEDSQLAEFLTANNLEEKSAAEIVDHLDRLGGDARPTTYMASVRANEILFLTEDEELELALPDDQFYISIAPFRENTHPCTFHSLTTCQGELTGEEFQVEVVDDVGAVVLSENRTSFENGFIGLWLPRDISGTITITDAHGTSGQVPFTTDESGATCITDLQLAA
ncbi:MAG TPA: CueP family metal-binding protein [Actinomycetales bacterium]|nr:CueP family metal-binding protein [Actinomycetales bacterium]